MVYIYLFNKITLYWNLPLKKTQKKCIFWSSHFSARNCHNFLLQFSLNFLLLFCHGITKGYNVVHFFCISSLAEILLPASHKRTLLHFCVQFLAFFLGFAQFISFFCTYFVRLFFRLEVLPVLFCKFFPSLGTSWLVPSAFIGPKWAQPRDGAAEKSFWLILQLLWVKNQDFLPLWPGDA